MNLPDLGPKGRLVAACALAVLGGILLFLGWAGFGYWPLEFVVVVPFWAALELIRQRRLWISFAIGWVYGVVAQTGGTYWMHDVVMAFSGFGPLPSLALVVGAVLHLGGQYAVLGLLYATVRRRGWSVGVAAVPTFVAVEWLYPTWFPVYLGNGLILQPLLVQMADLGGILFITALVVSINLLIFETLRWGFGKRSTPTVVALSTLTFLGAAVGYGAIRIAQVDAQASTAPTLEIGIIQPNIGIGEGQEDPKGSHRKHLVQSQTLEREGPLDLLVWPESSYRYPTLGRKLPIIAKEIRRGVRAPLLFGGISGTKHGDSYSELFNTVFYIDQEGVIAHVYDKVRLLAFGEFIPFGKQFPVLHELAPNTGNYDGGRHLEPFVIGSYRVSTPICYEDSLPMFMRKMVNHANPHLLINLTNDAWFGDSFGALLHFRMAQVRAVEHRRYLVRATSTGVSGVVDPVGRSIVESGIGSKESIRATVGMMDGRTVYGVIGDWPGWFSLTACVFLLARQREHPSP